MRKSASVKNFVLLIRVMLWERARSRYGMSVLSGRYGCRTWGTGELWKWTIFPLHVYIITVMVLGIDFLFS